MKSSRAIERPTPAFAYCQPDTCKCAGVEPGKVYNNFDEAKADAKKLAHCNPVGFMVIKLKD